MEEEEIFFQPGILEKICSNLDVEEVIAFMVAYDQETLECPVRFFDPIDQIYRYLPNIDAITFQTYTLIKEYGSTKALLIAADRNLDLVIETCLKIGIDVNATDDEGITALMKAAEAGNDSIVLLLLNNKANVNAVSKYRWTALMFASINGHDSTVKILLNRGAQVDAVSSINRTALIFAASKGRSKVVSTLLEHGADINQADNQEGDNALMVASEWGHDETVKILLDHSADVNSRNRFGMTAMDLARSQNRQSTIQLLKSRGALG